MADLIFFVPTTTITQPEAATQYTVIYPAWILDNFSNVPRYEARAMYITKPPGMMESKSLGYFDSEQAAQAACEADWDKRKKK